MAEWNTPAGNAAINKRPCDQKIRWVFGQSRLQLSARANGRFGSVSRVTPVHTAMRNCTRDEGRSFEIGNQVLKRNRSVGEVSKAD